MTKARFILAFIAIVGIIGVTFAFKAARRGVKTYYTTTIYCSIPPCTPNIPQAIITTSTTVRFYYWTTTCTAPACNYNRVKSDAL